MTLGDDILQELSAAAEEIALLPDVTLRNAVTKFMDLMQQMIAKSRPMDGYSLADLLAVFTDAARDYLDTTLTHPTRSGDRADSGTALGLVDTRGLQ